MPSQISQRIRETIDFSPSLQFAIELGCAGYQVPLSHEDVIPLHVSARAFRSVQEKYANPCSRQGKPRSVDLSALLDSDVWHWWRRHGNVLVGAARKAHLQQFSDDLVGILSLDPPLHGIKDSPHEQRSRFYTLHVGQGHKDVIAQPQQDLLVVSYDTCIDFLSLKSGIVHERVGYSQDGSRIAFRRFLGEDMREEMVSISGDWLLRIVQQRDIEHGYSYDVVYTCHVCHWPSGSEWVSPPDASRLHFNTERSYQVWDLPSSYPHRQDSRPCIVDGRYLFLPSITTDSEGEQPTIELKIIALPDTHPPNNEPFI